MKRHWTCQEGALVDRGTRPVTVVVIEDIQATAVEGPPQLRKLAEAGSWVETKAAALSRTCPLPRE